MKGTFICSVTDILIYISTRALFIPYSLIFVLTLLSTLPIIFNFIGILGPKLDRKPLFVIVPNGISYIIPFFNLSLCFSFLEAFVYIFLLYLSL